MEILQFLTAFFKNNQNLKLIAPIIVSTKQILSNIFSTPLMFQLYFAHNNSILFNFTEVKLWKIKEF